MADRGTFQSQHIICGMCNSYPADWCAHEWRCPKVRDTRRSADDACEMWTAREDWKPDPPMYSLMRDRDRRNEIDKAIATPEPIYSELPESNDGYVYFIQCGEYVKIGFSQQPASRVSNISTSSPYPVKFIGIMVGTMETERAFHREFSALRQRGEWFALTDELMGRISKMCGRKWRRHLVSR